MNRPGQIARLAAKERSTVWSTARCPPSFGARRLRALRAAVAVAGARVRTVLRGGERSAQLPGARGFLIADDAVWVEHAAGGFVYTEKEVLSGLVLRFDTLRGECYRVSESVALLERLEGIWKAGASPLIRTATAETA